MKINVSIEGLRELDEALGELPKATGRNVMRRALMAAVGPIVEDAQRLAPVRSGRLQKSIMVSTKASKRLGLSEYAEVMRGGGSQSEAYAAMRAVRASNTANTAMQVYVGPSRAAPHAHLVEFGSANNSPQPFLRPAWDAGWRTALESIKGHMRGEIDKAVVRLARKQARLIAKTGG